MKFIEHFTNAVFCLFIGMIFMLVIDIMYRFLYWNWDDFGSFHPIFIGFWLLLSLILFILYTILIYIENKENAKKS